MSCLGPAGTQAERRTDDIRPFNEGIRRASKGGRHQKVLAKRRTPIVSPRPAAEARVRTKAVLTWFARTTPVVATSSAACAFAAPAPSTPALANNPAPIPFDPFPI